MLSKSLIQFSVDGWGYVPSLWFGLRPNYGKGSGNLLQKDLCCSVVSCNLGVLPGEDEPARAPRTVVFSGPVPTTGHC